MEEKIETFLTQFKSLDAMAYSIIEEMRMLTAKNEAQGVQIEKLEDRLSEERREIAKLSDTIKELEAKLAEQESDETPPVKAKKASKPKTTKVVENTPSLF